MAASRAARSGMVGAGEDGRLDARRRGPLERLGAGLVGADGDDLDALAAVDAIQDRLEVRARAGGQDPDAEPARQASSSFGKRPPVERRVPAVSSASTRSSTASARRCP